LLRAHGWQISCRFESLWGRDVLDGADISFVQPIRRFADTLLPG
jgi:endonuclease G